MARKTPEPFANGVHDLRRGIDFTGISCSFICHDGQGNFLMHKRSQNCRDEQGTWDCGAGALELNESVVETVKREIYEEYGANAKNLQFLGFFDIKRNLDDGTPTHWICIMHAAEVDPQDVKNNEPHKIDELGWFTYDNLPKPLHSQVMKEITAAHEAGII